MPMAQGSWHCLRLAAAALAAALLLAAPRPAAACSSFVVNCEPDGAVVTGRTFDFSQDLTQYTSECALCVWTRCCRRERHGGRLCIEEARSVAAAASRPAPLAAADALAAAAPHAAPALPSPARRCRASPRHAPTHPPCPSYLEFICQTSRCFPGRSPSRACPRARAARRPPTASPTPLWRPPWEPGWTWEALQCAGTASTARD